MLRSSNGANGLVSRPSPVRKKASTPAPVRVERADGATVAAVPLPSFTLVSPTPELEEEKAGGEWAEGGLEVQGGKMARSPSVESVASASSTKAVGLPQTVRNRRGGAVRICIDRASIDASV